MMSMLHLEKETEQRISVIDLRDASKKQIFKKVFLLLLLKVYLHHFSKIKSQKEVRKQYESRFFLLLLLDDRRIRIVLK